MKKLRIDPNIESEAEGEINRWEVHHSSTEVKRQTAKEKSVPFVRLIQREPNWASIWLAIFHEEDEKGTFREGINLTGPFLNELINDLIEARETVREVAMREGYTEEEIERYFCGEWEEDV